MGTPQLSADSFVDLAYEHLKERAVTFGFKPGERLNEIELSREIGLSRTPLREALNRLNTEGFLKFVPGKGFFCRDLNPRDIYDLYELRKLLEVGTIRVTASRATDADIDALSGLQDAIHKAALEGKDAEKIQLDESFHERLVAIGGNPEILRVLRNVNGRIRFVRVLASDEIDHEKKNKEHLQIIKRLRQRDGDECARLLESHISLRLDQITAAIKEGIAMIYLAGDSNPAAKPDQPRPPRASRPAARSR